MMACVSGLLRNDMVMYTGRQLVRELLFLKQLPRVLLMEITLRFKLVIFIEGDIIFKIHTIGELNKVARMHLPVGDVPDIRIRIREYPREKKNRIRIHVY